MKKQRYIFIAMLGLWVCSMPIVGSTPITVLETGQVRKLPKDLKDRVDAVVVLSGMLTTVRGNDGFVTEWGDPDRFFGGLEVWNAGKADKIIFTRGQVPWARQSVPEGEYLKDRAIERGVPQDDILITHEVENTAQEAQAVNELMTDIANPTIILVTSAFHMPRAARVFEGEGISVIKYPVDFKASVASTTIMSFLPDAGALSRTSHFAREMLGRLYYWMRG